MLTDLLICWITFVTRSLKHHWSRHTLIQIQVYSNVYVISISYGKLAPQNGHSWIPRNIFFRHFGHRGFNIDERITTPTAPNPRPIRKFEYLRLSGLSALDLLFLSIIIFTSPIHERYYTNWHTHLSKVLGYILCTTSNTNKYFRIKNSIVFWSYI